MPGRIEDDPEYQAGRAEIYQHRFGSGHNPEWGTPEQNPEPEKREGCGRAAAVLTGLTGIAAAYLGHKYGVTV